MNLRRGSLLFLLTITLETNAVLALSDSYNSDPSQWTGNDVYQILNNSPWTKTAENEFLKRWLRWFGESDCGRWLERWQRANAASRRWNGAARNGRRPHAANVQFGRRRQHEQQSEIRPDGGDRSVGKRADRTHGGRKESRRGRSMPHRSSLWTNMSSR